MFDRRNNLSFRVWEEVNKCFSDTVFKTVIPRNVKLSESPSHGKPALLYDISSKGAESYLQLASEIIEKRNDIENRSPGKRPVCNTEGRGKSFSKLIPIDRITPNKTQPRLKIDEKTIAELASSIKGKGLLQPIILRRKEKGYEIIAGERRFRAAVMAGLKEVPAIIKDVDEKEALEIALI